LTTDKKTITSWILPKPINNDEIHNCLINYTLQKVLCRRGIHLEYELDEFLIPSELPKSEDHFHELSKATQRIIEACDNHENIAICGDYDADGMTSTILLVELLNLLGANAISYIPSRQDDGYGLNLKIIEEINEKEIKLIITVDNGVSAFEAIHRSKELGIDLIITDHHKIPENFINVFALIHPEQTPNDSPYKFLAGVGIAYMLAKNICKKLHFNIDQTSANALFCIGTVADMAPLIGANRKWLKECLPKINTTNNIGIRSILKKLEFDDQEITSDDIGYKIAPLINAVGRIDDPKLIFNLLSNKSKSSIEKLTNKVFSINNKRKTITANTVNEALIIAAKQYENNRKFLVISNREWHSGIIGLVAARIAENFNLPTAILSLGNDGLYRGSIRSNNLLKVNKALDECKSILLAYGGHSAAAGFTIKEDNIPDLELMLNNIATKELNDNRLSSTITPDAYLSFKEIDYNFYRQMMLLGPFGMKNNTLTFWTRKCKILDINYLKGKHIKVKLDDGTAFIDAIKWNDSSILNINDFIDIAFYIEINKWRKSKTLQLNIIDIKKYNEIINLKIHDNNYKCKLLEDMTIEITNSKGNCISSDLLLKGEKENLQHKLFVRKILSFAEVALGRTA